MGDFQTLWERKENTKEEHSTDGASFSFLLRWIITLKANNISKVPFQQFRPLLSGCTADKSCSLLIFPIEKRTPKYFFLMLLFWSLLLCEEEGDDGGGGELKKKDQARVSFDVYFDVILSGLGIIPASQLVMLYQTNNRRQQPSSHMDRSR